MSVTPDNLSSERLRARRSEQNRTTQSSPALGRGDTVDIVVDVAQFGTDLTEVKVETNGGGGTPGLFLIVARAIKSLGLKIRQVVVVPRIEERRKKLFYVKRVDEEETMRLLKQNVLKYIHESHGKEGHSTIDPEIDPVLQETLICSLCNDLLSYCVTLMPCSHTFDGPCLLEWRKSFDTCPRCSAPIEGVAKDALVQQLCDSFNERNNPCAAKKRRAAERAMQNSEVGRSWITPAVPVEIEVAPAVEVHALSPEEIAELQRMHARRRRNLVLRNWTALAGMIVVITVVTVVCFLYKDKKPTPSS